MQASAKSQPVLIKRYGRSRLYDTTQQCYVTLDQLREWAAMGIAFSVVDTDTGPDVTRVLIA